METPYEMPADVLYAWQERAAIYEYDADVSRPDAELQAQLDVLTRIASGRQP